MDNMSNLVRLVMVGAAELQGVAIERISFVDALLRLRHARHYTLMRELVVIPHGPHRHEICQKVKTDNLSAHE